LFLLSKRVKVLNGLLCADEPLRNYTLTQSSVNATKACLYGI